MLFLPLDGFGDYFRCMTSLCAWLVINTLDGVCSRSIVVFIDEFTCTNMVGWIA